MQKAVTVLSLLWLAPLWGAGVTGDAEGLALTKKCIAALGGEEGIAKRRMIYMEQEVTQQIPGAAGQAFKATVTLWQKGDKRRMEQRLGVAPGSPNVVIYDGKELFLLVNGARRDPGTIVKKTFEAGKKREDLWWNCLKKPLRVASKGAKEIRKKTLWLLEYTHLEGDTTIVGLDTETHLPLYVKWKALHPYTGREVEWVQWQTKFLPMKEADNLLFPVEGELLHGDQKMWSARTTKVRLEKKIPDSLFGEDRPVD
jgi:hypothetical protein